jgi:hypothetical protein
LEQGTISGLSFFLKGSLDDLRDIYNRTLSIAEIEMLFNDKDPAQIHEAEQVISEMFSCGI